MKGIKSKRSGVSDINLNLETLTQIMELSDRILFIDKRGNIVGSDEKIWDKYPFLSIIKLYESLKKGKERGVAEFEDEGRNLKITGKQAGDFFLLEIEDITSDVCIEEFKKKIISTISHELKTPLTVIKGYVELLSLEFESELTEKVIYQVDRVISIVNSVSLLMKGQKGKFESIDVGKVIKELVSQISRKLEVKKVKFMVDVENGVVVVAEKILFCQMIINLLDNAVKFTEEGEILLKIYREDEFVVVEVKDTGRGIPEDLQPFIFEKFVKSKESPGLGIGLSLVKTIAKHHGWEIDFCSRAGEGTAFFVKIPTVS